MSTKLQSTKQRALSQQKDTHLTKQNLEQSKTDKSKARSISHNPETDQNKKDQKQTQGQDKQQSSNSKQINQKEQKSKNNDPQQASSARKHTFLKRKQPKIILTNHKLNWKKASKVSCWGQEIQHDDNIEIINIKANYDIDRDKNSKRKKGNGDDSDDEDDNDQKNQKIGDISDKKDNDGQNNDEDNEIDYLNSKNDQEEAINGNESNEQQDTNQNLSKINEEDEENNNKNNMLSNSKNEIDYNDNDQLNQSQNIDKNLNDQDQNINNNNNSNDIQNNMNNSSTSNFLNHPNEENNENLQQNNSNFDECIQNNSQEFIKGDQKDTEGLDQGEDQNNTDQLGNQNEQQEEKQLVSTEMQTDDLNDQKQQQQSDSICEQNKQNHTGMENSQQQLEINNDGKNSFDSLQNESGLGNSNILMNQDNKNNQNNNLNNQDNDFNQNTDLDQQSKFNSENQLDTGKNIGEIEVQYDDLKDALKYMLECNPRYYIMQHGKKDPRATDSQINTQTSFFLNKMQGNNQSQIQQQIQEEGDGNRELNYFVFKNPNKSLQFSGLGIKSSNIEEVSEESQKYKKRLKSLKEIFNFYCKQNITLGKKTFSFGRMESEYQEMNNAKFALFGRDFNIYNQNISQKQIVQIWKKELIKLNSDKTTINLQMFTKIIESISQLYFKDYPNLNEKMKIEAFYQYLLGLGYNDYHHKLIGGNITNLKEQKKFSESKQNFEYQVISHPKSYQTGEDLMNELQQRKLEREQREYSLQQVIQKNRSLDPELKKVNYVDQNKIKRQQEVEQRRIKLEQEKRQRALTLEQESLPKKYHPKKVIPKAEFTFQTLQNCDIDQYMAQAKILKEKEQINPNDYIIHNDSDDEQYLKDYKIKNVPSYESLEQPKRDGKIFYQQQHQMIQYNQPSKKYQIQIENSILKQSPQESYNNSSILERQIHQTHSILKEKEHNQNQKQDNSYRQLQEQDHQTKEDNQNQQKNQQGLWNQINVQQQNQKQGNFSLEDYAPFVGSLSTRRVKSNKANYQQHDNLTPYKISKSVPLSNTESPRYKLQNLKI